VHFTLPLSHFSLAKCVSSLSTAKLNKSDTIYTEFLKQEKSMEEEKVRWGMGILEDEVEDETNKALILTEVK